MRIHLTLAASLCFSSLIAAQGTFTVLGTGCAGSGCPSSNANTTATSTSTHNTNIFALGIAGGPQTSIVLGFELYTRSTSSSNVTIATQLYAADSTGLAPGTQVASSTMVIGSTLGWYKTTFTAPQTFKAGQKYFISYTSTTSIMFPSIPSTTAGAAKAEHYWHSPTATTWSGPFSTQPWTYRVNCLSGNATPILSWNGLPTVGTSFTIDIASARVGAPALLLVGLRNDKWAGGSLPQDMTSFGASGCTLYTSLDYLIPVKASSAGMASLKFGVPNNAIFKGLKVWGQYVVDDKATAFGMVFSAAVAAIVG